MQFTGLEKEESSITGYTKMYSFDFHLQEPNTRLKELRMYEKFRHCLPFPGTIMMEFSFERVVTERD